MIQSHHHCERLSSLDLGGLNFQYGFFKVPQTFRSLAVWGDDDDENTFLDDRTKTAFLCQRNSVCTHHGPPLATGMLKALISFGTMSP